MSRRFDHFITRCEERGIASVDPTALALELQKAIREEAHDYVERVYAHADAEVWRFRLHVEGFFFAVVSRQEKRILTVLTKEMLRNYKDIRRGDARCIQEAESNRIKRQVQREHRGVRKSKRRCKI